MSHGGHLLATKVQIFSNLQVKTPYRQPEIGLRQTRAFEKLHASSLPWQAVKEFTIYKGLGFLAHWLRCR